MAALRNIRVPPQHDMKRLQYILIITFQYFYSQHDSTVENNVITDFFFLTDQQGLNKKDVSIFID